MGIGPIRTELHGMVHSIHSWVQWLFIEDVLCAEDFQRCWAKSKVPVTCCSHIYSLPLQSALFQVTGANPTDYISLVTSLLAGSLLNSANESTGGAWRVEGREKWEWACFSLSPSPSLFFRQCLQQTGISSISLPLPTTPFSDFLRIEPWEHEVFLFSKILRIIHQHHSFWFKGQFW